MENPESKSKWDDLVRELAVEVPPEVQQREEAVASAPPKADTSPSPAREVPSTPAPKRAATNWSSLNADLGLPPIEEPEPVVQAAPVQPEVQRYVQPPETPREREREPEQARGGRPERGGRGRDREGSGERGRGGDRERPPRRGDREDSGRRREQPERERPEQARQEFEPPQERTHEDREEPESREDGIEQGREQSEPRRDGRGRRGGRGGRGRGRGRSQQGDRAEQRGDRGERNEGDRGRGRARGPERERAQEPSQEFEAEEVELRASTEIEEVTVEPTQPKEPAQKSAAVSLWHKIFGSPAEQTAKVVDEPSDEVGSPSDLRNEPRSAGSGFADAHADDQMSLFDRPDDEQRSDESQAPGDEEDRSDRQRGRRRRGRGRGRGRKQDDRPTQGRGSRERSAEPRVERSNPELEDEFTDEELMGDHDSDLAHDDDDDSDDAEGVATGAGISRSAALQRSIPSWDEAIGFIVDSNMSSRSQRRPPARSGGGGGGGSRENGSRGGRGRGRGRGRS